MQTDHVNKTRIGKDLRKLITPAIEERFWDKVLKRGPLDCWPWTGAKHNQGYGVMRIDGSLHKTHRVAYAIAHGECDESWAIRHTCSNSACMNPAHMHARTDEDRRATKPVSRIGPAAGHGIAAMAITPDVALRFWEKVDKSGSCWTWTGSTGVAPSNYGQMRVNGRMLGAHRISYAMHFGDIPARKCVLHRCDNPLCVRPDHLWLGDMAANAEDREHKGRGVHPRGEASGNAKITEDDVRDMRRAFESGEATQGELAARYRLSQPAVHMIIRRKNWRHVA